MSCADVQVLLLEADLEELRGEGDGALAEHLRACAACRASARHILDAERALDVALEAEAAQRGPTSAIAPAVPPGARRSPGASARPKWRRVAPWGLVAAAAALAVLVGPRFRGAGPPREVLREVAPAAADVDATPAAGSTVVLFRTADPTITVVWFY